MSLSARRVLRMGLLLPPAALGFVVLGCGPKTYEPMDASRLAARHARPEEKARALDAAGRCDRMGDLWACVYVAQAMERADEKNDALTLYDHACASGLAEACVAAARVRESGPSEHPPSAVVPATPR